MYLGVDLGTSGIKVILLDNKGNIVDSHTSPFEVSRPFPLWSEQNPDDWWQGLDICMCALSRRHDFSQVKGLGLSGQMHGATLLDKQNTIIRPAILWNDGRCEDQCKEIEAQVSNSREITGNIMMPGFTAPKLLWVKQHEPKAFQRIHKVLLPKDYLRFLLTGDYASDMSDSAGTCWLDVGKRDWHAELLAACGLDTSHMPTLCEGNQVTGHITSELAARWKMNLVPVIAGGGDNAAGAIGVGLIKPGQGMISLGTSGVYFLVSQGFCANPDKAVHSFCHALPNTWHLMSVLLSAASCLQWFADNVAQQDVSTLLVNLDQAPVDMQQAPLFLPYLSGERTPHNNPHATGNFFGLTHSTQQNWLTHAVLEGVSFAFADGVDVIHQSGAVADEITLIGGGARSAYWRQMLADVLNTKITVREGGEVGPALGAARLAQLAIETDLTAEQVCPVPIVKQVHTPNPETALIYQKRRQTFRALYQQLRPLFLPQRLVCTSK